jgi:TM2 domain-containing membrane protein YozV
MSKVLKYLPELEGDEQVYVAQMLKQMSDPQAQQFANVYRARRREPTNVLLLTLLGFVAIAGAQRFYVDQIGMGLLYLFTGGFCFIGTILDCFRYQNLAFEFNRKKADEAAATVMSSMPDTPDSPPSSPPTSDDWS